MKTQTLERRNTMNSLSRAINSIVNEVIVDAKAAIDAALSLETLPVVPNKAMSSKDFANMAYQSRFGVGKKESPWKCHGGVGSVGWGC